MSQEKLNLRNRKVLVVGLGKTGEAVVDFLEEQGALVSVSEKKPASELGPKLREFEEKGIRIESGGHKLETFLASDLIIPSPGVPLLPEIKAAQEAGIPVLSEIELAGLFIRGELIGITGTNGKSTTTTLIYLILKTGKKRVRLAGNIGVPLIRYAATSRPTDIYVTEISSFQLAFCQNFRCRVAAFLNFSPNHLDWHGSIDAYWEAKKKLFINLTEKDMAILNRDDAKVWSLRKEIRAWPYFFSQKRPVTKGAYLKGDRILLNNGQEQLALPLKTIKLRGAHNIDNVMVSLLVGQFFGVPLNQMKKVISQFPGLEHRLEKVLILCGITFFNDSKATTVDATLKAINSLEPGIILIMGGRDKGADFTLLRPAIKGRVRHLVLLGEAREKIRQALKEVIPISLASTMREAVNLAFEKARPGESVLLSPACTSFDMFANFEHRGRVFKQEVRRLARWVKGSGKK